MLIGEAKQIGKRKYVIMGQGESVFDAIMDYQRASFYGVQSCGLCGSDDLILRARVAGDDEYKYSEIKCLACKAQLVLGETKKTKEYYLRKNKSGELDWNKFTPKET